MTTQELETRELILLINACIYRLYGVVWAPRCAVCQAALMCQTSDCLYCPRCLTKDGPIQSIDGLAEASLKGRLAGLLYRLSEVGGVSASQHHSLNFVKRILKDKEPVS